jgi:hypothetical protein
MLCNKASFYGEELSTPLPTTKLEKHPLSAVRDCLFNIFSVTFNIGGRSSIRNLRMRHAVVTGTHLSIIYIFTYLLIPLLLLCYVTTIIIVTFTFLKVSVKYFSAPVC